VKNHETQPNAKNLIKEIGAAPMRCRAELNHSCLDSEAVNVTLLTEPGNLYV